MTKMMPSVPGKQKMRVIQPRFSALCSSVLLLEAQEKTVFILSFCFFLWVGHRNLDSRRIRLLNNGSMVAQVSPKCHLRTRIHPRQRLIGISKWFLALSLQIDVSTCSTFVYLSILVFKNKNWAWHNSVMVKVLVLNAPGSILSSRWSSRSLLSSPHSGILVHSLHKGLMVQQSWEQWFSTRAILFPRAHAAGFEDFTSTGI